MRNLKQIENDMHIKDIYRKMSEANSFQVPNLCNQILNLKLKIVHSVTFNQSQALPFDIIRDAKKYECSWRKFKIDA